jgi:hypothetical protein
VEGGATRGTTALTGESRFHISIPLGFETGSLVTGSKRVVTGPVRHGENEVRLQALHRAPPQQPTPSVVKLEGGPAASMKPGQKSCAIKSINAAYTWSARSLVKHLKGDEAADLHIIGAKPSEAPEG